MKFLKTVSEGNHSCSLELGRRRCGGPAETAVQMEGGSAYWRCRNHEGWVGAKAEPVPRFGIPDWKPVEYGNVITKVAMNQ